MSRDAFSSLILITSCESYLPDPHPPPTLRWLLPYPLSSIFHFSFAIALSSEPTCSRIAIRNNINNKHKNSSKLSCPSTLLVVPVPAKLLESILDNTCNHVSLISHSPPPLTHPIIPLPSLMPTTPGPLSLCYFKWSNLYLDLTFPKHQTTFLSPKK